MRKDLNKMTAQEVEDYLAGAAIHFCRHGVVEVRSLPY